MANYNEYDLIIIGAGVTGSALLYMCARHTNIRRIAVIEKYDDPAQANSAPTHNSQTLHCGDIETNYTLEKALEVQRAASMVRNYAVAQPDSHRIIHKYPKMVLGVGTKECNLLADRFEMLKPHYPALELFDVDKIHDIEPNVTFKREEEILALGSTDEYTAVDFEQLTKSFIRRAYMEDKVIEVYYNEKVTNINRVNGVYNIKTKGNKFFSDAVVVCAGGHSLQIAHNMGYGESFSILPVAGSYYYTKKVLNGKVYTVQNDALPFAAVHGDPDVLTPHKTRFGPTAIVLPLLERYKPSTVADFFDVLRFDKKVAGAWWNLIKDEDIRNYMLKNILFEIPMIRERLFLKDAQKIVPSLELKDLKFANGIGGVRPQLIDKDTGLLVLGESKIHTSDGCIFNVTPSPGGTSCLANAEHDAQFIADYLGAEVYEHVIKRELFDTIDKV